MSIFMESINDRHEIWAIYSSSCIFCKHGFNMINFTCKAFPKEIPDEILAGKDLHHVPFKEQKNDIVFKPQRRYLKMKTLIPVLLIMLLLSSCEKKYCWRCDVTSNYSGRVISSPSYCDRTTEEIMKIEDEGTDEIFTKRCTRY